MQCGTEAKQKFCVPAGSVPEAQEMLSDMKFRKEKHIGKNSKFSGLVKTQCSTSRLGDLVKTDLQTCGICTPLA